MWYAVERGGGSPWEKLRRAKAGLSVDLGPKKFGVMITAPAVAHAEELAEKKEHA